MMSLDDDKRFELDEHRRFRDHDLLEDFGLGNLSKENPAPRICCYIYCPVDGKRLRINACSETCRYELCPYQLQIENPE